MVGRSIEAIEDLGANGHTEFYVDPTVDDSTARAFLCDVHAVSRLWDGALFRAMVPWDVTAVSHSLDVVASLGCGLSCCPGSFLWDVRQYRGCGVSQCSRAIRCGMSLTSPARGMSPFATSWSGLKSAKLPPC